MDIKQISFRLLRIKTEQFATFGENLPVEGSLNLGTEFEFILNSANKQISAFALFTFEQNQQVMMKLEVSSHFAIDPASWEQCDKETEVTFPKSSLLTWP